MYWDMLVLRIEALSRRERMMVLLAAVVCVVALLNALLLEPLLQRKASLQKQIVLDRERTVQMQAQIQSLQAAGAVDPDAANRARLAELNARLQEVDASLDGLRRDMVSPDKMSQLLESMLGNHKQLKLVALKTLPVTMVNDAASQTAPDAQKKGAENDIAIFKHGVEITVEGRYLDLLEYLSALEQLPWQLLWSKAAVSAGQYPNSTLTVSVYTLSLEKTWLSI